MIQKYFKRRKSPLSGFFILLITLIPIFTTAILFLLYLNESEQPDLKIYFEEIFSNEEVGSWILVDASVKKEESSNNRFISLTRENFVAPHIHTDLEHKNSPQESFVWKLSTKINHFSDDSMVLGTLKFPTGDLSIVINKEGRLGLSRNMFSEAIFTETHFSALTKSEWENISLFFDKKNNVLVLFLNEKKVLTTPLIEQIYPIREIWLGSVWIGGKENYGAALDVQYDNIVVANEGAVPPPSFWEFATSKLIQIFE